MMKAILIGAIIVSFLLGGILLIRDYYVKRKFRKVVLKKYQVVEPLMRKLEAKEKISREEILSMATSPSLRHALYKTLEVYNRKDMFPAEYFTTEKAAESFLVNWLEFPTELGNAPDQIELLTKINVDGSEELDYYVFRYKTTTPRWAAERDWMLGVCGPYGKQSAPFDTPLRVFSRFNSADMISPETEVQWVHENISKANP